MERLHELFDVWLNMLEEERKGKEGKLDEIVGLSERKKHGDIQKAGASLAAEVPYEKAEELFKELTGLSLSDHTMHGVVGDIGEGLIFGSNQLLRFFMRSPLT